LGKEELSLCDLDNGTRNKKKPKFIQLAKLMKEQSNLIQHAQILDSQEGEDVEGDL